MATLEVIDDGPPQEFGTDWSTYADGGVILGPEWKTMGYISDTLPMYVSPYLGTVDGAPWVDQSGAYAKVPSTWSGGPIEDHVPDALCPNCRRDRHDFPLSEAVAEMWKSLLFTDYDPAADVSRIVCPGSDVCGPAVPPATRVSRYVSWTLNVSDWVIPGESMTKYWESFNFDTSSMKVKLWSSGPMTPEFVTAETVHEWEYEADHGWSIADLNAFKGKWSLPNYTYAETFVPAGIHAFAPIPQAAIEAAPKQLEHEAPQSPGFDFASMKTDHQPTYPGKKKHK